MRKFILLIFMSFITQANAKDLIDYASVGDAASVSNLLKVGADPNIERDRTTPLKAAAITCPYSDASVDTYASIVSSLLSAGADRDKSYENNSTLAMLLVEHSRLIENCDVESSKQSFECNRMMNILITESKIQDLFNKRLCLMYLLVQ